MHFHNAYLDKSEGVAWSTWCRSKGVVCCPIRQRLVDHLCAKDRYMRKAKASLFMLAWWEVLKEKNACQFWIHLLTIPKFAGILGLGQCIALGVLPRSSS
jgi:hypothetical protein